MSNSGHLKELKNDQKIWSKHFVDKNLQDSWLVDLNHLRFFNLISICEGHIASRIPADIMPHINLRIKPVYSIKIDGIFTEIKAPLSQLLENLFEKQNYLTKIKRGKIAYSKQKDFMICISGKKRRVENHIVFINEWFFETIERIRMIDEAVALMVDSKNLNEGLL